MLGIVENMSLHVCSNCGHVEHMFGAGGGQPHGRAVRRGTCSAELPLDAKIRERSRRRASRAWSRRRISPRAPEPIFDTGAPHGAGRLARRAAIAAAGRIPDDLCGRHWEGVELRLGAKKIP